MKDKRKQEGTEALSQFTNEELLQIINARAAQEHPNCDHEWIYYNFVKKPIIRCKKCQRIEDAPQY